MFRTVNDVCSFTHIYPLSVIVDASDACNVANFDINGSGTNRQWEIKGETRIN